MEGRILLTPRDDWSSFISNEDHLARSTQKKWHSEDYLKNISQWNFCLSYPAYRQCLAEIHYKNIARLNAVTVSKYDDCDCNHAVVLCDDDDWLSPTLFDIVCPLLENRPEIEVVRWRNWQYRTIFPKEEFVCLGGVANPKIRELRPGKRSTASNGFVIRGGLSGITKLEGLHGKINNWDTTKLLDIDEDLSVWVRHQGATYRLAKYPFLPYTNLHKSKIPSSIAWAREEVKSFREVSLILRGGRILV